MGRNSTSTEGDTSHGEKQAYQNAPPIPTVTIHSFIMGVFVSMGGMFWHAFIAIDLIVFRLCLWI
jgi:hypothetical protein